MEEGTGGEDGRESEREIGRGRKGATGSEGDRRRKRERDREGGRGRGGRRGDGSGRGEIGRSNGLNPGPPKEPVMRFLP